MLKNYANLSTGQMHYRFAGSGEAVILLHMSGSSSDEYENLGNLLSDKFTVYAPDFFGFGSSDQPVQYFSFEQHAVSVIELMDYLGIQSAYFLGNLVGANIAAHIAAEYPTRVKKLLLFHPCYNPDPNFYKNMRYAPVFSEIKVSPDGSHLSKIWASAAKYGEPAQETDDRAVCLHRAGPFGEALHWALCEDDNFESVLTNVTCPTVMFAYDGMENETVKMAAKLPVLNCEFILLEHATPYFFRVAPQTAAAKVLPLIWGSE